MIISACLSAVQSIHPKYYGTHPLISDILEIQNVLEQTLILLWIPSYAGIHLNEKADKMAKEALNLTEITDIRPTPDDFLSLIPKQLKQKAQHNWNNSRTLTNIHPKIETLQSTRTNYQD